MQDRAPEPPLAPGDPIGVSLVRGDLVLGATGTVTHVDGNQVYAFGHPFFNLGPTEFPMTRAYVHALLPSLFTSQKIASIGDIRRWISTHRSTSFPTVSRTAPTRSTTSSTTVPYRARV